MNNFFSDVVKELDIDRGLHTEPMRSYNKGHNEV